MSVATIALGFRKSTLLSYKAYLLMGCNRPKKICSAPDPSIIQSLEQKIGKLKISLEEAVA